MVRFILNFIFFGIIYYLIWRFEPHWIDVMRSWAESAYDIVANLLGLAVEKIRELSSSGKTGT